jgi:hypothetical protein
MSIRADLRRAGADGAVRYDVMLGEIHSWYLAVSRERWRRRGDLSAVR